MMAAKGTIPVESLRELLDYNPDTGRLFWRYRDVKWFSNSATRSAAAVCSTWNTRFAGKEAFKAIHPLGCGRVGRVLALGCSGHLVAWALYYGEWPTMQIDHINGDPTDNRIKNLRLVTSSENARNKKRAKNNKSGVVGVRWYVQMKKWHVQIGNGHSKNLHVGFFETFDEAVAARRAAEVAQGYHPNHGRSAIHQEA